MPDESIFSSSDHHERGDRASCCSALSAPFLPHDYFFLAAALTAFINPRPESLTALMAASFSSCRALYLAWSFSTSDCPCHAIRYSRVTPPQSAASSPHRSLRHNTSCTSQNRARTTSSMPEPVSA